MQLHNNYIILAKGVTTDAEDQTISLFKLVDELTYDIEEEKFKEITGVNPGDNVILPASLVIASAWRTDDLSAKDITLNIVTSIYSPSGEKMGALENSVLMHKAKKRIKFNVVFENIPLSTSGTYQLMLEIKDDAGKVLGKANTPLDVVLNFNKSPKA